MDDNASASAEIQALAFSFSIRATIRAAVV
jgi:hypothetical protein